ncbi:hypothetical protein [uncultured Shimia sp.]|uniref:hypothetical protein n=1 Tax=uncultured Shimia sp. TaxID=573152 RepID=UPI002617B752|nr:hypothetical protein [uncultured Shimia sp.]
MRHVVKSVHEVSSEAGDLFILTLSLHDDPEIKLESTRTSRLRELMAPFSLSQDSDQALAWVQNLIRLINTWDNAADDIARICRGEDTKGPGSDILELDDLLGRLL